MVGGILLLVIVIFGISLMFGKGKVENYFKFLIWLIVTPILISIGFNHFLWFWYDLPFWTQISLILVLPFLVSALLRAMFPKAKWLQVLQTTIFQTLIYIVAFPFRLVWRTGRLISQKESQTVRLNPYPPVVGGRPPLQNEGRKANPRGNIFD